MIPLLYHIGIVFLTPFCNSGVQSSGNCILEDETTRSVGSVWINNKGCTCQCIAHDIINFAQCENCKKTSKIDEKQIQCYNNGFSYYENETWMSLETACSQCKCGPGGKFQCETDKHCSNTCPEGQIPQYGSCCEVLKCSGKATKAQVGIRCWDRLRKLEMAQGDFIIMPELCIDKFCICYNGNWMCHNYCNLSIHPLIYWNKLCCPRPKVFQFCKYRNQTIPQGQQHFFNDTDETCSCLNDHIYCSKSELTSMVSISNHSSSSTALLATSSSQKPQFPSITLILFLVIIFVLLCSLAAIIVHSNRGIFKRKIRNKKTNVDNILLTENKDEQRNDCPSQVDVI